MRILRSHLIHKWSAIREFVRQDVRLEPVKLVLICFAPLTASATKRSPYQQDDSSHDETEVTDQSVCHEEHAASGGVVKVVTVAQRGTFRLQ